MGVLLSPRPPKNWLSVVNSKSNKNKIYKTQVHRPTMHRELYKFMLKFLTISINYLIK